jgi:hypothetical protein
MEDVFRGYLVIGGMARSLSRGPSPDSPPAPIRALARRHGGGLAGGRLRRRPPARPQAHLARHELATIILLDCGGDVHARGVDLSSLGQLAPD